MQINASLLRRTFSTPLGSPSGMVASVRDLMMHNSTKGFETLAEQFREQVDMVDPTAVDDALREAGSRQARVLEDDDSQMPVKTALALINRVWEEIEQDLDAAFDAATQVALAWYATYVA